MKKRSFLLINILIILITLISSFVHVQATVNELFPKSEKDISQDIEELPETEVNEQNGQDEIVSDDGSLFLDLVKMMFMLAIVLGLIYFLLKFLQKRNKMFQQVRSLENLGGISLGSNKSLQMVRIGKKVFVIGVGENVNMLTEIEDKEFIEDLINNDQTSAQGNSSIHSLLNQFKGFKGKDQKEEKQQFKNLLNNELKSLSQERKRLIENHRERKEDQHE